MSQRMNPGCFALDPKI